MILFIDSSVPNESLVRLDQFEAKFKSTINHKQQILVKIDELMKGRGLSGKEIDQIEVVVGPGSFTGVRVGVAIANALALSWDVPIVGIKNGQAELPTRSVLPFYDHPANVSKKSINS